MDSCILALDEICDSGILLDADPMSVLHRVSLKEPEIPLGEQTVFDVFKLARDQLKSSFR